MFNFMVTNEGGLTTAGYAIAIIAGIILFLAAICFAGKHSEKHKLTTRQLVFCAVAVALAFVTSYLKIFTLPWGGSVTPVSYTHLDVYKRQITYTATTIPTISAE